MDRYEAEKAAAARLSFIVEGVLLTALGAWLVSVFVIATSR
jgi:hypothetical protein